MAKTRNKVILSYSNILDFSTGMGNITGGLHGKRYSTAIRIYNELEMVDSNRILGAEVTLWGEMSNEVTLENNLWMRAAAFGERMWAKERMNTTSLVRRMTELASIL